MRRLAVVAAVALAGCSFSLQGIPKNTAVEATVAARTPAAELPAHFKVATFNIYMQPGDKVARAMLADRSLRDLDLIVLQEVKRSNAACSDACVLGKALGMHAIYAAGHSKDDGNDYGIAILSKAKITSAQILELPWHDVHFNAGRRIALAATLRQNGRPITVYAVHLENRLKASDRKKQMQPILEHAAEQATPVIIAGDFNTNPFTWVSHWLPLPTAGHQQRALESFVRSYGFDAPVAGSGATHRYIGMKLDAIYTRGFDTRRFATARASDVSDHLALWAAMTTRVEPIARQAASSMTTRSQPARMPARQTTGALASTP
jgi:endonuclease/exonuclease/phosphatase family metal-dependent hydrolase